MIVLKINIMVILFISLVVPLSAQPQLPVAGENIIFEATFDSEDMSVDIAEGKPYPTVKLGKILIKKSPWGKALYCGAGGAKLRYEIADNIKFWERGTVLFWFYPMDWAKVSLKHPRVFFFGVESSRGFLGVQVASGPKSLNIMERKIRILLLYFKQIPATIMKINGVTPTGDKNWQLLAITWSKNELGLSLNGAPFAIKKIAGELKKEYFKGRSFSVGSNVGANYLLDTFRIYNRRLTDQELKTIYTTESIR